MSENFTLARKSALVVNVDSNVLRAILDNPEAMAAVEPIDVTITKVHNNRALTGTLASAATLAARTERSG